MIIYFYLFIPFVFRLAESSSIKGRNHRNELVPFLSSSLDPQKKDNSLKIVSNEPFVIQFQMPPRESGNVDKRATLRDKKTKRQNKKRDYKSKPLRKKIRRRRDLSEIKQLKKPPTEEKGNHNKTQNSIGRLEILKALHSHAMKTEIKKLHPEMLKKTPPLSSRNPHRHNPTSLPDTNVKMTYPSTPKTEPQNYSYKDLIADRERLEQKISYIKNLLQMNDTKTDDGGRVRRRSESDKAGNKLAKMFLTLTAANRLRDKRKPRCNHEAERAQDVWEKERRKSATRQSSSSNEQRYKVKKWIEYMKNKRSSGKTCTCMETEYNEDGDVFPLEQKLSKGYPLSDSTTSSEESSEDVGYGRLGKNGNNRNQDARSKFRSLANAGKRKYELPLDDLEVYRTRAKQILQNAEEILDKIKEEEERRLSTPAALVSHLKELTSRIQGDPRNNENDLIKIIQKNLGWSPQSKSESDADGNTFAENVKSLILNPYEKAKALTDESTRKLSTYLLRNLGKIGSEEQEEAGRSDQSSQVYHGQTPQTEEMFSANLAKEMGEDSARGREEMQKWSDTLSEMLRGKDEDMRIENAEGVKQTIDQEDALRRRMEEIIQEQGKKISEYAENPEIGGNEEGITAIDLMTGEQIETPKESKPEGAKIMESSKEDENKEKIDTGEGNVSQDDTVAKESVKLTDDAIGEDVRDTKDEETLEERKPEGSTESARDNVDENEDDKVRVELPLELEEVKAAAGENTPKEDETIAEEVESAADKDLEPKADVSQKEDMQSVELEKKTDKESTEEAVQSSQEGQEDDTLQAKEDRDENDVINSKHLVEEGSERSSDNELEEFAEDIQKLVDDNAKEKSEETTRQDKEADNEATVMKNDSSEREDGKDEEVSSDSVELEKQTEIVSEETQDAVSEGKDSMSGVIETSQDPKESLENDGLKKEASGENEGESIVASELSESVADGEKAGETAEEVVEKAETSFETDKETVDDSVEKSKSAEEESEREDDTLKFALEGKEDETVREGSDTENDNQEKEISGESLDERDRGDQEETLKASLSDPEKEQKSDDIIQKSMEEHEENTDENAEESAPRSENDETVEEGLEKATKQSQEESEEAAMESEEVAAKEANASESQDKEELKETETDLENEDEPQLRAEQSQKEDVEPSLRSENLENGSNESAVDTTNSEEKEENKDEALKATADEENETTDEAESAEEEKVEKQRKNSEEDSKEADAKDEESLDVIREPKLLMTVEEGLGQEEPDKESVEEGKDGDELVENTWTITEEEGGDEKQSGGVEEESREANPEEESEEVQGTNDEGELSVRAENIQDLDNEIDSDDTMMRAANEDATLAEVNSSEEKNLSESDVVEGGNQVKEVKEVVDESLGRENVAESEESQNFGPNLSKSALKVPKSIGKIMRDLDGKEKDEFSLTNLNPEEIDHFIDKIDEAELQNKLHSEDVDCRKECACADEIDTKARNIGRYEIVKDFLHWAKDLQLNRVLTDN